MAPCPTTSASWPTSPSSRDENGQSFAPTLIHSLQKKVTDFGIKNASILSVNMLKRLERHAAKPAAKAQLSVNKMSTRARALQLQLQLQLRKKTLTCLFLVENLTVLSSPPKAPPQGGVARTRA